MTDRRYVALFDIHCGYDWRYGRDGWIKRPTHDISTINAVNKFIIDFAPDVLILGGDQLNCGSISHWNSDKSIAHHEDDLAAEFDIARAEIIEKLAVGVKQKIWIRGNHEDNIYRMLARYPQLGRLIDPECYLGIRQAKDWEIIEQGKIYRLGKLNFLHGENISAAGNFMARNAMMKYFRNLRFGHYHTWQTFTFCGMDDEKDKKTSVAVPCLCHTNPAFMKNSPNQWLQGLNFGMVAKSGNFWDITVPLVNDKFVIDGKEYRRGK